MYKHCHNNYVKPLSAANIIHCIHYYQIKCVIFLTFPPPTPHTRTCRDFDNLNAALLDMIREQRKVSTGEDLGVIKKKDSMKDAEDKLVQVGKKARNEVSSVHGCRISLVQ